MIDIKDCNIHIGDKLNDCFIIYDEGKITYTLTYIETTRYYFTAMETVHDWRLRISYDIQTRYYSSVYRRVNGHRCRNWDSIPKIRKQVVEDLKEIYMNTILTILKIEGKS